MFFTILINSVTKNLLSKFYLAGYANSLGVVRNIHDARRLRVCIDTHVRRFYAFLTIVEKYSFYAYSNAFIIIKFIFILLQFSTSYYFPDETNYVQANHFYIQQSIFI